MRASMSVTSPEKGRTVPVQKCARNCGSLQSKFLTTQWMHYFCGGDYTRFVKRCTLLRVDGNSYLRLPRGQRASPNTGYKNFVYELSPAGRKVLKTLGRPMLDVVHRSASYYHEVITDMGFYAPLRYAVDHDPSLRLINAAMLLGLEASEHGAVHTPAATKSSKDPCGFRLDPLNPESKIRRFDGPPFVLVRTKADGTWDNLCVPGIEVDRNANEGTTSTDPDRTTIGKHIDEIIRFKEARLQDHYLGFGKKIFVPILFSGETPRYAETHMRNVMDWVFKKYGSIGYIGFQTVEDIAMLEHFPEPNGDTITSPWKRVGFPDLYMNKA